MPEEKKSIKVGDGLEIRGVKFLVAAINAKGWLLLEPYANHNPKEGMSEMMTRIGKGVIPILRKE